ncbi:MAG: helix-turn-helix domain-containing protein [Chromatiaceae bacterium]|nr:helix-turn-helix domain-containing protein [Chromatiaceae bacterium]
MHKDGRSHVAKARTLHRSPSTISREWRRHIAPTATPGTSGTVVRIATKAGQFLNPFGQAAAR